MSSKLGGLGFRLFSRFDRKVIFKICTISVQNTTNGIRHEVAQSSWKIFQKGFCSKTVGIKNSLTNSKASTHCAFEKTQSENGRTSDAPCADNHAESSNKFEESEFADNTHSISNERNSEELENCAQSLDVPQGAKNELMSKFHLPSDWGEKYSKGERANFPGEIFLIRSQRDESRHADVLEGFLTQRALGFDSEHSLYGNKRVCLVQLATREQAVLWQFCNSEVKMPKYLKKLLTGDVLKVGHSVMDDAILVSKQFREDTINLVDTLPWATDLNCSPKSLQALCALFNGTFLSKKYQTSNWTRLQLHPEQVKYAATDAWVSLIVYQEMERHAKELGITLTPMYKTIQQYYDQVQHNKRERRKRQRQRAKEKKRKASQLLAESSMKAETSDIELPSSHIVSGRENVDS